MKPKHRNTLPLGSISGLALVFTATTLHAQTAWDGGGGNSDYSNNLNWAGDVIPGNGNNNGASIGNSNTQSVIYNTATNYTSNGRLIVGSGTSGNGSLTLSGSAGTLTFGGDGYNNAALIGTSNTNSDVYGNVTVSAGKLAITAATDASINLGVQYASGTSGVKSGTLLINGGTVEVGRRILMGANSNSTVGLLTISSGTLDMKRTGSNSEGDLGMIRIGQGTNTVNLDGGTVIFSGFRVSEASNARSTIFFNGTTLRANANNTDFLSVNGTTANTNFRIKNGGLIVDTNNLAITINDNLTQESGHTGILRKEGLGTLTLSGISDYTGGTTLDAGTINIGAAISGSNSAIGSTSGTLTVNGGTLNMAGNNVTVGNLTGSGGVISGTSGNRLLTIGQGNTGGGNYQGQINNGTGGTTALTKTGNGTITLSGTNGYTGLTTVSAGTLLTTRAAALPGYNAAGRVSVAGGATLAVRAGGAGEWSSSEIDSLLGATTAAFAATSKLGIDVTTGNTFTYAGNIGATQANKGLVKTGAGTLTLSTTNTYTGPTTVSEGTLVVDGSIANSSLLTVSPGATISGSGTIGALTVSTDGFISPGNSPGILNTGNYTQAGLYEAEINGITPGTEHDQINVTGTVDITGGSLSVLFSGTYAEDDLIFILVNDLADPINGTFTGLPQGASVTSYGGFDWQISYLADNTGIGTFTGGNDIALMAVLAESAVIPEPSAFFLGSFGLLAAACRRRR